MKIPEEIIFKNMYLSFLRGFDVSVRHVYDYFEVEMLKTHDDFVFRNVFQIDDSVISMPTLYIIKKTIKGMFDDSEFKINCMIDNAKCEMA